MKGLLLCFLFLLVSHNLVSAQKHAPIKHFVILMLENRSFDHMLGHMKQSNPNIRGLNGTESNPIDPSDATSAHVRVSFNAPDVCLKFLYGNVINIKPYSSLSLILDTKF